jgi:hypothetical protein
MKEALENLVKKLVNKADEVSVIERQNGSTTILEVRVAEGDMGRLIGREGRTVKAIRSLLYAASQKRGQRFQLDLVE